jgi:hypothetical protein
LLIFVFNSLQSDRFFKSFGRNDTSGSVSLLLFFSVLFGLISGLVMGAGGRYVDINAFTKLMGCCAFWLFFSVMLALTGRLRFTLALLVGLFTATSVHYHICLYVLPNKLNMLYAS